MYTDVNTSADSLTRPFFSAKGDPAFRQTVMMPGTAQKKWTSIMMLFKKLPTSDCRRIFKAKRKKPAAGTEENILPLILGRC